MTPNALQAVLDKAVKTTPEDKAPPPAPTGDSLSPARALRSAVKNRPAPEPEAFRRAARDGKKFVGGHFDPEVARQLKMLAAEDNTTIQDLLEQAVDLLFVKAGKARISQVSGPKDARG